MIFQNDYWFDILPRDDTSTGRVDGKWLFFGPTEELHAWLESLNALVESRKLRAAKVARKLPGKDPFPNKPCVLCVFTSDQEDEKAAARQTLKDSLGIEVEVWKSELDTERDWAPGGWLRVESDLNELRRELATGGRELDRAARGRLAALSRQLRRSLTELSRSDRAAEIHLNQAEGLVEDLDERLGDPDAPLGAILLRLDRIQTQIDRLSSGAEARPSEAAAAYQSRPKYLFVLMPFAERHIDTYDAIRRAAAKADSEIEIERVDEKPGSIPITDAIRKSIRAARLIVCDLTDERPNVYYELGYAHGLEKDVICVAKQGTAIHFDVYGLKILFFDTLRTLETRLAQEIQGLLRLPGSVA